MHSGQDVAAAILFEPIDLLEEGTDGDMPFVTSMHGIGRVAVLAAEVGARFVRDGIDVDPAAWLHAPRRMFGGASAVVAAQKPVHFRRAMMLHRLQLGLDADPEDIDALLDDEEDESFVDTGEEAVGQSSDAVGMAPPALFCATITEQTDDGNVYAFYASVAGSIADFERTLAHRFGSRRAMRAIVSEGFDEEDLVAAILLSEDTRYLLRLAERDPRNYAARKIDVQIEQRIDLCP